MKQCSNCNYENDNQNLNCVNCGKPFDDIYQENGDFKRRTNVLSIASLVTGILTLLSMIIGIFFSTCCCIAGLPLLIVAAILAIISIITGIISLKQINRLDDNGKPLAVTGLCLGTLSLIFIIIAIVSVVFFGAAVASPTFLESLSESLESY
ncbi:MAG: DUF4190 domain-containing protein [Clostridiales bacterium]